MKTADIWVCKGKYRDECDKIRAIINLHNVQKGDPLMCRKSRSHKYWNDWTWKPVRLLKVIKADGKEDRYEVRFPEARITKVVPAKDLRHPTNQQARKKDSWYVRAKFDHSGAGELKIEREGGTRFWYAWRGRKFVVNGNKFGVLGQETHDNAREIKSVEIENTEKDDTHTRFRISYRDGTSDLCVLLNLRRTRGSPAESSRALPSGN